MKYDVYKDMQNKAYEYYEKAHIILSPQEKNNIEIADFGLNEIRKTGLQLVTYVNTDRVCAKEMVLLPHQTCPEHKHPNIGGMQGKEETFRCRYGSVYLYVEGEPAQETVCKPPAGDEKYYTVFHEIILKPGEQHTICPDTLHWFQAGSDGAVVSEFSTKSTDESDVFTDTRIKRAPEID